MEGEQRQGPFWDYLDLLLFLASAIPAFLIGIGITKVALRLAPGILPGKAAQLLTGQFIGYALWFACLAIQIRTRYNQRLWPAMSWKLAIREIFPALTLGVVLALSVAVIGTLLRAPQLDNSLLELMKDRLSILVVAFFATTLGPLFEELAFRGFLLPLLIRSVGAMSGIFISALSFALLHGPQYHWSWQHLVLLTAVGCVFGWTRFKTGSTGLPTIMHASYNAVFMGAFIASKREYF